MRKHIFKYLGWEIYFALTLYESYYSNVDPNSQVLETLETTRIVRDKSTRESKSVEKKGLNTLLQFIFYIAQNAGNTDQ